MAPLLFFGFVSLRVCVYLSTHTHTHGLFLSAALEPARAAAAISHRSAASFHFHGSLSRSPKNRAKLRPSSVIDGSYHLANSVIAGFSALTWTTSSKLTTEHVDPRCNDLAHSSRCILRIRDSDKSLSLTWSGENGGKRDSHGRSPTLSYALEM